ncbi:Caleosin related protein-domain-containing protein [Dendryphion nanum]|uniref:Caleosin related protein-domain-containing protein n=1 Tax=Dendryphion nanum TaxID=256645 RepID=A0A9P9DFI1_9PLEO|nr:Caleosin related protein-domain-containing protein [Dendryphion nanum]
MGYQSLSNGVRDSDEQLVRSIKSVPITEEQLPFVQEPSNSTLPEAGVGRVNLAPSVQSPNGTTEKNWASRHSHQTVLQQHCDFFDTDKDGIIWPMDTFRGFHALGFGVILSFIALFIIHINFSYPTSPTWLPDPFFRLYLKNAHRTKHGSDTGTYDAQGRFIPQKFEDIFSKYAEGRDYLTVQDVITMFQGQRCISDPIGWGGFIFEWGVTYLMLWPEDGRMKKEDIRGVYDGSIFYNIAAQRANRK